MKKILTTSAVLAVAILLSVLFTVPSMAYADGSKIAFNSNRDGNYEIYVMNADGSGQTRLTNNPATDYYPSFSPDGSKIAFNSYRDGNNEIYVMNANGSGQTRLTNNTANDIDPSFSHNGTAAAAAPYVAPVWIRTGPMVCANVWVNEKGNFQFVFWYPYRDNNWVKIYDTSGKQVFSIDMPLDNPQFEVSLPDGMYTVKTFTVGSTTPIQTFTIGKNASTPHQDLGELSQ